MDADDGQQAQLHLAFKALADPTRRRILDYLREKPRTTGWLSARFENLSRYAVMKHLRVLEEANLVVVRRAGRRRFNHLNYLPIRLIYECWMGPFVELWSSALLRLKGHIEVKDNNRSRR